PPNQRADKTATPKIQRRAMLRIVVLRSPQCLPGSGSADGAACSAGGESGAIGAIFEVTPVGCFAANDASDFGSGDGSARVAGTISCGVAWAGGVMYVGPQRGTDGNTSPATSTSIDRR